ncbi:MAG TPA: ABC transporter substrate-binding protein [Beijerinckiaceae bacterium]|jgi:peptide/nickel transport system substrate-binding protein
MTTTRRGMLAGGLAAVTVTGAPGILRAQTPPSRARTIRAVMHADLRVLDPIWTTANITAYHGAMIYDTLFAMDADFNPQPQMVGQWGVSDDRRTYTFALRDGLKFSDGAPVTAADCVASLRRWAARDGAGQHLFRRVKDTPVADDKTFKIVLSEPYGLLIGALSKLSTSNCWMMRRKDAETDPNQQIRETIGSGPFLYNRDETRPGNRYVYDRNPDYVPRAEPASGLAGGKRVKIDRAVFENIGDEQTSLAALQNGEIDFFEVPPQDLVQDLEKDPNLTVRVLNKTGHIGFMRMNFLHPPFDNVDARRGMQCLINQADVMRAIFGESKYWRTCGAYFACGTPMENDENTDWFKSGPDLAKAKELFRKSGYDGRPVVVLQPTDHYFGNPAGLFMAQWLRQAGVTVDLAASDWGAVLNRRAVKKPPGEGGWNIFSTTATGEAFSNPINFSGHAANGDKAWFGWPSNDLQEKLRDEWAAADSLDERKRIARELQKNAWDYVHHLYLGQFFRASAWRKTVTGVIGMPEVVPFWNMEKTG